MSILATTWVRRHSKAKGAARLVLDAIADFCPGDSYGGSFPSYDTIAAMAKVSRRTAISAVKALEAARELEVIRGGGRPGRGGRTNLFRLVVDNHGEMAKEVSLPSPEPMTTTKRFYELERSTRGAQISVDDISKRIADLREAMRATR